LGKKKLANAKGNGQRGTGILVRGIRREYAREGRNPQLLMLMPKDTQASGIISSGICPKKDFGRMSGESATSTPIEERKRNMLCENMKLGSWEGMHYHEKARAISEYLGSHIDCAVHKPREKGRKGNSKHYVRAVREKQPAKNIPTQKGSTRRGRKNSQKGNHTQETGPFAGVKK